jgi:hypothetical protein
MRSVGWSVSQSVSGCLKVVHDSGLGEPMRIWGAYVQLVGQSVSQLVSQQWKLRFGSKRV